MDLELLNCINADLKWNSLKKGRRSTTRCPKKPGADSSESGNKRLDTTAFETNKIVDASLKKRKLLQQSPLPPPQTPCLHGDRGLPDEPLTPSIHYEDLSQQYHTSSISKSQKTKSKTRLTNKNISKKVDFSGIELLAATACSSLIHDTEDHVNKEHTVLGVDSCSIDIKEAIISNETGGSSNQDTLIPDSQNLYDDGNQKVAPSKELRLHWDLNTVMDDWEEPCDDLVVKLTECVSMNAAVSTVLLIKSCNGDSLRKSCEPIEDLGTKTITSKTSDCESCVSKSDVVDSLIQGVKCEDVSTSTTSALQEETIVKCESMSKSDQQLVSEDIISCKSYCDNKVSSEDPPSDCCGSNVTQDEQGHMDKVNSGYDSPFEDGELRENNESSDNTCNNDFGTIENPLSEKVNSSRDHGQTMEDESSLLVKEAIPNTTFVQDDTFERPHSQKDVEESDCGSGKESSRRKNGHDESTSFAYVPQSRCSNMVRGYDYERDRMKTTNRNYTPSGGCQNRRPSSSERINGYGGDIHRASNRYRFHSQEYNHDSKPYNLERKVRCYSPKRRSGSPIAWHFQKRKNSDETQSHDHVSPERFFKSFDDRKFTDGQFRDKRLSRFDSIGYKYNERSKSDDHFRFSQQSGRFSNHKYKDSGYTYTRK